MKQYYKNVDLDDQYLVQTRITVDEVRMITHPNSTLYTIDTTLIGKNTDERIELIEGQRVGESVLESTIAQNQVACVMYLEEIADPENSKSAKLLKSLGFELIPPDPSDIFFVV